MVAFFKKKEIRRDEMDIKAKIEEVVARIKEDKYFAAKLFQRSD